MTNLGTVGSPIPSSHAHAATLPSVPVGQHLSAVAAIAPASRNGYANGTHAADAASGRRDLTDTTDLSGTDRLTRLAMDLPDVRQDLINRVRAEIAAGTYETDEKINGAIDTLLMEEADRLFTTPTASE